MKEKLFYISKWSVFFIAIIQLAISQIHIAIITKVFETDVGFFLFLFIIFGLVSAFNAVSAKKGKKMYLDFTTAITSSLAGYRYLTTVFANIAPDKLLTFEDASISIYISIVAIFIYIVGTITMFLTKESVA
jgi:hypothetical protein